MKTLRIAFYLSEFPILSQTFILNQIVGMIERGHDVDIYASERADLQVVHPDVATYDLFTRVRFEPAIPRNRCLRLFKAGGLILSRGGWRLPIALSRSLRVVKFCHQRASLHLLYSAIPALGSPAYDVIHAQFGPLGLKALALRQIGAIQGKLVTSFRGFDATRRLKDKPDLYADLFREGDLFLPVSRSLRQHLIDHGCDEKKIKVHHSGIDCSKFGFSLRRRGEAEETRIVSVARLVEKKGISYALRAVARLIASGRKVAYSIVGDGELRPALESMIAELGVGQHVNLLGWKTHDGLIRLMDAAHILVAPSITAANGDQEGIPNSVKEAMAMGLPVVSTLHGGIPELVDEGFSGFLVPEADVETLTDRLAHLHDHPELWPAMGSAGRSKIEREFDINKLNDDLVELYSA